MLQYRGFVRQDSASRAYEPGAALSTIAYATIRQMDIRGRARPILERVNALLGETVHLGRLEGTQVHFLDSIESSQTVRVAARHGRSLLAHCTSTGKAMLSQLSTEELRTLYPIEQIDGLTDRSLTTRTALERDLEKSRRRGYALSMQESEVGVTSVAVPVASPSGTRYAISASVPVHRMTQALRTTIVGVLTEAAQELSTLLI
jgi:DNA-binding IclR family transcriptional regulator